MAELTRGQKRVEYQKLYRDTHREDKKEWSELYWAKNKEAISERRLQQFKCDLCGGSYVLHHKSTHEKSNKHQNAIADATTSTNVASQS